MKQIEFSIVENIQKQFWIFSQGAFKYSINTHGGASSGEVGLKLGEGIFALPPSCPVPDHYSKTNVTKG